VVAPPAVIELTSVTIVGTRSRPSPKPIPMVEPVVETRLEPCSSWRDLAGGPSERSFRQLCEVPVAVGTVAGGPETAARIE
jgi:hypothetical protein